MIGLCVHYSGSFAISGQVRNGSAWLQPRMSNHGFQPVISLFETLTEIQGTMKPSPHQRPSGTRCRIFAGRSAALSGASHVFGRGNRIGKISAAPNSRTPKAIHTAVEAGRKGSEHGQLIDEATAKFIAEKGV
jgi:hypothetical protein